MTGLGCKVQRRASLRFFSIVLAICLLSFFATLFTGEQARYNSDLREIQSKLSTLGATYSLLYAEPIAKGRDDVRDLYTVALLTDLDVSSLVILTPNGETAFENINHIDAKHETYTQSWPINFADNDGIERVGTLALTMSSRRIDSALEQRLVSLVTEFTALLIAALFAVAVAFRYSLREAFSQLSHQANHDALTGLMNRRAMYNLLTRVLEQKPESGIQPVLMFIDLNKFKQINDAGGHQAGDAALRFVAGILRRQVRRDDAVARMGGDEFCILLRGCERVNADQIATNICRALEREPFEWQGSHFRLGASIGIVDIVNGQYGVDDYLRLADNGCYQAKRQEYGNIQHVELAVQPPPAQSRAQQCSLGT